MKIEDKDKIKETARIILDPENDKIPDSVVRMRTERVEITPLARSRSPAIKVSLVDSVQRLDSSLLVNHRSQTQSRRSYKKLGDPIKDHF